MPQALWMPPVALEWQKVCYEKPWTSFVVSCHKCKPFGFTSSATMNLSLDIIVWKWDDKGCWLDVFLVGWWFSEDFGCNVLMMFEDEDTGMFVEDWGYRPIWEHGPPDGAAFSQILQLPKWESGILQSALAATTTFSHHLSYFSFSCLPSWNQILKSENHGSQAQLLWGCIACLLQRYWDSLLYVLYENGGRPPENLNRHVWAQDVKASASITFPRKTPVKDNCALQQFFQTFVAGKMETFA